MSTEVCTAGRNIVSATQPGFQEPCPALPDEVLVVHDENNVPHQHGICTAHRIALQEAGAELQTSEELN